MKRYLRYELQMPICLLRWITGRRPPGFAYHQAKKLPVTVFMALLVFESLGTHLVPLAATRAARRNRRPERRGGKLIMDGEKVTFACGETTDPSGFLAGLATLCLLSLPGRR